MSIRNKIWNKISKLNQRITKEENVVLKEILGILFWETTVHGVIYYHKLPKLTRYTIIEAVAPVEEIKKKLTNRVINGNDDEIPANEREFIELKCKSWGIELSETCSKYSEIPFIYKIRMLERLSDDNIDILTKKLLSEKRPELIIEDMPSLVDSSDDETVINSKDLETNPHKCSLSSDGSDTPKCVKCNKKKEPSHCCDTFIQVENDKLTCIECGKESEEELRKYTEYVRKFNDQPSSIPDTKERIDPSTNALKHANKIFNQMSWAIKPHRATPIKNNSSMNFRSNPSNDLDNPIMNYLFGKPEVAVPAAEASKTQKQLNTKVLERLLQSPN